MEQYINRFLKLGELSCFIFGPRGTGKSTYLKHQLSEALWIDLRIADTFRRLNARPDLINEMIEERPSYKIIIIDEIQRIPDLLPMIHRIIEKDKKLQIIMTGSSARKLKKSGIDLLAGRAIRKEMHPFMVSELKDEDAGIDQWLKYGMLPIVSGVPIEQKQSVLETYISLYMEQEVYQESLVRKIGDFAHFLEIVSLSHGSVINISNISRDCGISRKTVESYLLILEDILLAFKVPVFTRKASRDITQHPKFYLFDSGVYQALRPKGPLDNMGEIIGHAIEGLVAQHLRAWVSYTTKQNKLYFWRNRYGHEVDFVIYGEEGLFAIDVKSTTTIRSEDLKGIKAFLEEYPIGKAFILFRGQEVLVKEKIHLVPIEIFLKKLIPNIFPQWF